jgi:hypothetical protein
MATVGTVQFFKQGNLAVIEAGQRLSRLKMVSNTGSFRLRGATNAASKQHCRADTPNFRQPHASRPRLV